MTPEDYHPYKYITIDPGIKGGTPVIRGTRIPIHLLVHELIMGSEGLAHGGQRGLIAICDDYSLDLKMAKGALDELKRLDHTDEDLAKLKKEFLD